MGKIYEVAIIVDPDVFYCRAVIFVRQDPVGSLRDLQRYMDMTRNRPDVNPSKQKRVEQTITMIRGCVEGSDPKQCVEQMVVEEARALAFEGHFSKEAVEARSKAQEASAEATPEKAAEAAAPVKKEEAKPEPDSANDADDGGGSSLPLAGGALAALLLFALAMKSRKSKES